MKISIRQSMLILLLYCSGGGMVLAESFGEKLLGDAVASMRAGNLADARKKLDQILVLEPNNAEAYFRIGELLIRENKTKDGWKSLVRATELAPQNVRYALNLSRFYEQQNDLQGAMRELQRIVDSGTGDRRVKEAEKRLSLLTGRSLGQKGEMNAALLIFNGLLLEFPNDAEVLYNTGLAYVFLNRVQEAENTFKKLAEIQPNNYVALLQLASIYERSGRLLEALEPLTQIIKLKPAPPREALDSAKYRHGIISARILLAQRNPPAALGILDQLIKMQPKTTEAYFTKGVALASVGQREAAQEVFFKVLEITPDDFSTRLNLGSMYLDWGKFEQAREQLKYIIENDKAGRYANQARKRLDVLHSVIAEKALSSGDLEESLKQFEQALEFNAGNVNASFNRGVIFLQQNRFEEAAVEFESAVRYDPKFLRARSGLAFVYEKLQRYLDAAEQYEAILKIDPNTPEGRDASAKWRMTKARGLWFDNRLTDAEILLMQITAEEKNNFAAFVLLGIIQASKSKLREAASNLQTALDLNQNAQPVRLQLASVYEQLGLDELAAQEYRLIIFNGAPEQTIDESELRLRAVEARLSGFFRTLAYTIRYDDNVNANPIDPLEDIFSEMAFNIIFGQKISDDVSFRITTSPTYMNMHHASVDFLRMDINSSLSLGPPDENWTLLYGSQNQVELINETSTAGNHKVNATRSRKLMLPALFGLAPPGLEKDSIPTSFENLFVGQYVDSYTGAKVKTASGGVGIRVGQGLKAGISYSFAAIVSAFRNVENVVVVGPSTALGNGGNFSEVPDTVTIYDSHDYEYNSYNLSLDLRKTLGAGVMGSITTNLDFRDYINFDSGAKVQKLELRRRSLMLSFQAGINYNFYRDVRFFMNGNWTRSVSNLDVGYFADAETSVASFQSTALGDYAKFNLAAGMVMNF